MSWGTTIPAAIAAPITREDGSLDWSPVTQAPNYNPSEILNDPKHALHAAWLIERDRALTEWENAKTLLEKAKESEAIARKYVQSFAFGSKAKEGVNSQPLAGGYELKFGNKLNYNLKASNDAIDAAEDKAAASGNRGTFLFERIVTWEPKFSKSEYNKLDVSDPTDKAVKEIIDGLVTITPATGSLEIKAPKATLNG